MFTEHWMGGIFFLELEIGENDVGNCISAGEDCVAYTNLASYIEKSLLAKYLLWTESY